MTKLLKKAINKIRMLPDAEQDVMAALILEEFFDKQQWDTAFIHSQEKRSRLPEKARGENHHEIPDISKHADWNATVENAERISNHIKKLIENSRVQEARKIVSAIRPGVSAKLDYWKKVLTEPVAKVGGPGTGGDMRKDILWFEKNADNYKGKWVALKNGVLLGSHKSRAELRQNLKQSGKLARSLFIRIEN